MNKAIEVILLVAVVVMVSTMMHLGFDKLDTVEVPNEVQLIEHSGDEIATTTIEQCACEIGITENEVLDLIFDNKAALRGEKGDTGQQGIQGIQGIAYEGNKGDTGDKGDKGDTGERGIRGYQGVRGIDGNDGIDGIDALLPSNVWEQYCLTSSVRGEFILYSGANIAICDNEGWEKVWLLRD